MGSSVLDPLASNEKGIGSLGVVFAGVSLLHIAEQHKIYIENHGVLVYKHIFSARL